MSGERAAYGWDHQKARAALPPPNGEGCPFCHKPMWPGMRLDADHEIPVALGGGGLLRWSHARCNRRAGAKLGARMRRRRAPVEQTDWLGRWR